MDTDTANKIDWLLDSIIRLLAAPLVQGEPIAEACSIAI
jgi:hypothetical protein